MSCPLFYQGYYIPSLINEAFANAIHSHDIHTGNGQAHNTLGRCCFSRINRYSANCYDIDLRTGCYSFYRHSTVDTRNLENFIDRLLRQARRKSYRIGNLSKTAILIDRSYAIYIGICRLLGSICLLGRKVDHLVIFKNDITDRIGYGFP